MQQDSLSLVVFSLLSVWLFKGQDQCLGLNPNQQEGQTWNLVVCRPWWDQKQFPSGLWTKKCTTKCQFTKTVQLWTEELPCIKWSDLLLLLWEAMHTSILWEMNLDTQNGLISQGNLVDYLKRDNKNFYTISSVYKSLWNPFLWGVYVWIIKFLCPTNLSSW